MSERSILSLWEAQAGPWAGFSWGWGGRQPSPGGFSCLPTLPLPKVLLCSFYSTCVKRDISFLASGPGSPIFAPETSPWGLGGCSGERCLFSQVSPAPDSLFSSERRLCCLQGAGPSGQNQNRMSTQLGTRPSPLPPRFQREGRLVEGLRHVGSGSIGGGRVSGTQALSPLCNQGGQGPDSASGQATLELDCPRAWDTLPHHYLECGWRGR